MQNLIFLDVEATGVSPEDRLIQLAYRVTAGIPVNALFKPPVPIKKGAMAIHHVTEKMVVGLPSFIDSSEFFELARIAEEGTILVAHNAPYDLGMLAKEGIVFNRFIDTLKIAKYLDDGQFENHTLQYLRYHYDLEIDLGGLAPHDALADIIVLEQVFKKLAEEMYKKGEVTNFEEAIAKMEEISKLPLLIKICTWKQHPGKLWADVVKEDRGLVEWGLRKQMEKPEHERDHDLVYTFKYHLGV